MSKKARGGEKTRKPSLTKTLDLFYSFSPRAIVASRFLPLSIHDVDKCWCCHQVFTIYFIPFALGFHAVYPPVRLPRHPAHPRALHGRADRDHPRRAAPQHALTPPGSVWQLCHPACARARQTGEKKDLAWHICSFVLLSSRDTFAIHLGLWLFKVHIHIY